MRTVIGDISSNDKLDIRIPRGINDVAIHRFSGDVDHDTVVTTRRQKILPFLTFFIFDASTG
jgi:hypothetical protein